MLKIPDTDVHQLLHEEVSTWKYCLYYWPCVRGIWWLMDSPCKGPVLWYLCCYPEKAVEHTVIWDTMTSLQWTLLANAICIWSSFYHFIHYNLVVSVLSTRGIRTCFTLSKHTLMKNLFETDMNKTLKAWLLIDYYAKFHGYNFLLHYKTSCA